MTTITSRRFNQDASGAKRAAAAGPVFITDRGRPAHVLMTIDEYRRLTAGRKSMVDLLAMEGPVSDDFDELLADIREEPRRQTPRPVDLD